jgi:Mrp family chromosome partitioning ATPase
VGQDSQEQNALLTDYDSTTAYSQAFYTLFANIRFHLGDGQGEVGAEKQSARLVHTLLVTGASTYKSQATIAANLAIVSAQSGSETVLVDADLRTLRSSIGQHFGLAQSSNGLSDLLEEDFITPARIASSLQTTFVPGLRVLSSGSFSSQGTALLLSSRLEAVIAGMREVLLSSNKPSGMIIFHCAPVLTGADASLIGALVEQTVLTVVMGQTTRVQGRQAQEQLEQAGVKLGGVVMLQP